MLLPLLLLSILFQKSLMEVGKTMQAIQPNILQDKDIDPQATKTINQKRPRLTITIEKNGQLKHDKKIITEIQLSKLCKEFRTNNPKGSLHIKADHKTKFTHIRSVIKIAAQSELDNVIFSAFGDNKAPSHTGSKLTKNDIKKLVETDLEMSLPVAPMAIDEPPVIEPMFIKIDKDGSIFINSGAAQEKLDHDTNKRNLPLLRERIAVYSAVARAGGVKPEVQIWADPAAKQQRVVDVINALASEKISRVTFSDKIDK